MIEFDRVVKSYPDGTVAVSSLTLTAPEGAITVLVGPSGCGKTTSLRMINRMIEPTSGTIRVGGRDTATLDPVELRRGIGYVIQHGGLFPHRTVLDNVMTVPALLGWSRERARTRAKEMLELVGLDPAVAGRYPHQLSGGQQQRVGVARALAADPPVMLLDEPFSAVDPIVRVGLQQEFLRLQRDVAKTIVFVTHDIDEAITLGDRIAVLRVGGELAQLADPAELLRAPADDFVAGFVGKDRGYRALSFVHAPVPVCQVPTVRWPGPAPSAGDPEWRLAVDDAGRPLGWIAGHLEPARLVAGGTLAREDASLRELMDAALSSPSGLGVVVDGDGVLLGAVRADDVLAAARRLASGPPGPAGP